ncbi:GNAT family N-acetyltransferase [uncultured Algibacter sp.]|uniref:GNAT family N-acetyltransferase n=1 Tax=uncultured Algibacter sp. TaxID=298659 RepID=UPI00261AC06D|nr:GNAT family N-acetyltransferase [uncultured Algibacter sp.]
MNIVFKIVEKESIKDIIPLVQKLNGHQVSNSVLTERFVEMFSQNYECAGIYDSEKLIGICGLWFCTRHYSGRSVEPDHVFIDESYRSKGLGKQFFNWIYNYAVSKGCEAVELNTYVTNASSHKFYFNENFKILGYHFLKKL